MLLARKEGILSKLYMVSDAFDLAMIDRVSPFRSRADVLDLMLTPNHYIRVVVRGDAHRDFRREGIHAMVPRINTAVEARKNEVERDTESYRQTERREVVEKEMIRVIVKIPCRYCKTLNDQLSSRCESCGAPLR